MLVQIYPTPQHDSYKHEGVAVRSSKDHEMAMLQNDEAATTTIAIASSCHTHGL